MLNDLEKKVVDMVYVDTFSLMDYKSTLKEKSLKMAFIDSKISVGYGFALSGLSVVLEMDIKSFIEDKSAAINAFAQSLHDRFPVRIFFIFSISIHKYNVEFLLISLLNLLLQLLSLVFCFIFCLSHLQRCHHWAGMTSLQMR